MKHQEKGFACALSSRRETGEVAAKLTEGDSSRARRTEVGRVIADPFRPVGAMIVYDQTPALRREEKRTDFPLPF